MRKRLLPSGWYPSTASEVQETLDEWKQDSKSHPQTACAAIAPHAGWYFSGKLAWQSWLSAFNADCVVVAGGHLGAGNPILLYDDTEYAVPGGALPVCRDLVDAIRMHCTVRPDHSADNTVEIQFPFCAFRFGYSIPVVGIRVPEDEQAIALGKLLADWSTMYAVQLFVLGSTDLTHYGPNYGFMPAGTGKQAEIWAANNDKQFIDACLALDAQAILHAGRDLQAACSSGGAACAASYAKALKASHAELLAYETSLAKHYDSSFVGYASIAFSS
ncbi:MAG TPA: AmmeMemoRadiSam system protein B [Spirochaetales bacterium]|nr:AmmeMemoRadiSam system protein B [Spirochaetales bacterium]HQK34506.1 AmmeMemoRadiSam system protein B [Spirochaetales bacterium]HRV27983.1 AmmeMemoRadiSam system protein B [Spirochaetia bacterium]